MKICPRCNGVIEDQRAYDAVIVCNHCGWMKSNSTLNKKRNKESRYLALFTMTALLTPIFVALFYVRKWDYFSSQVLGLQMKSWSQGLAPEDYRAWVKICQKRGSTDCMIEVSQDWRIKSHESADSLEVLGDSYRLAQDFDQAIQAYKKHLEVGGESIKAHYHYADLLAQKGELELAFSEFEKILASRPEVLQTTVLKTYIDHLIQNQQGEKALEKIKEVQKWCKRPVVYEGHFGKLRGHQKARKKTKNSRLRNL